MWLFWDFGWGWDQYRKKEENKGGDMMIFESPKNAPYSIQIHCIIILTKIPNQNEELAWAGTETSVPVGS